MKKIDLRVLRTRKMILEAFIELVDEKGYEAVTIQDISKRAMINRATFYAHFKDKADLYEKIIEFAISQLASILDADNLMNGNLIKVKTIEKTLSRIFAEIKLKQNFFLTLTEGSSNGIFRKKISDLLYSKYEDIFDKLRITENDIEVPISFIIEYMTAIFVATVHWWVSTKSDFSPEHMARLVLKLVGNGHLTVLGIDIEK
ncbi:TetR/AcrR family transcriptional regulator [Vagococcus acidifermentans]|uniref:TetR family transcriptional regulator n=1 Tax=Vagococcus acidifermentans TaxID=564710 RepID=A0A430ATP0_9ENTE|nr:TetR/AcrR family transcriptional regulator [Vagococcus acidifermentans]RSU11420.1 TetR family transcriptional regulator [Vagococcus acidifermentans]